MVGVLKLILKGMLVIVLLFLAFVAYLVVPDLLKSDEDKRKEQEELERVNVELDSYVPKKYGQIDSFHKLNNAILLFLEYGEEGFLDYRVKWYFINELEKYESTHLNRVLELYFIIYLKNTGAATSEDLGIILEDKFKKNINAVVSVVSDFYKFAPKGYNNTEHLHMLCRTVLPSDIDYSVNKDIDKKKKIIIELELIKNNNNKHVIDYMISVLKGSEEP